MEKYLVSHNINKEINNLSLLYLAVHQNSVSFTKDLVKNGADINIKDALSRTPLLIACFYNFIDIAKLLIENGADTEGFEERARRGWDVMNN